MAGCCPSSGCLTRARRSLKRERTRGRRQRGERARREAVRVLHQRRRQRLPRRAGDRPRGRPLPVLVLLRRVADRGAARGGGTAPGPGAPRQRAGLMTNPRLSVSALSSVRWSFDEDLALWRELGLGWAGLMGAKLGDDLDARFTALAAAGLRASTVVVPRFDLSAPASWDATRSALRRWTDAVAKYDGWSMYLTPGRPTAAVWEQLLDTLADAVAPSVGSARDRGVRLAFEPSRRTEVSFVNTLADAVDVAERTGLGIVADIGNFWMERDLRATLLRAAPHIDLVQLTDVSIGTVRSPHDPPSGGRVPFAEGDLPLARILGDIKDTGYTGPLELELIGPLGDSEGYAPVIRRGVAAADAMLGQAGL